MNRLPKNPVPFAVNRCFLAGGSILSIATKSDISDYDIYPKSKEAMIDLFYNLDDDGCFIVNISDRAITWKSNDVTNSKGERAIIQVMTFDQFETPEKIFEFFDFSVCMGAFDTDTEEYHFHPDFWPSVASKTLYFNPKTRYPLNSVIRVGKYTSKGYYLPKPESVKMSLAVIRAGMPASWEELEAAIGGSYGRQVKLAVGDKEFSYEAALELLNELVLEIPEEEEDFSSIKAEHLESMFQNESVKLLSLDNESMFESKECIVSNERLLPFNNAQEKEALEILGVRVEYLDPNTVLEGYKVLRKNENGDYENAIYSARKLTYKIDEITEEPKSPHIFVFPTAAETKTPFNKKKENHHICKVSFLAGDVVSVSKNEYKVKKIKLEEVIEQ